ncbi:hypothetical protein PFISCL1PPCAC_25756, partial [Pristionchus fissidentatus]
VSPPSRPSPPPSTTLSPPHPLSYLNYCHMSTSPPVDRLPYPTTNPHDLPVLRAAVGAALAFAALLRVSELVSLRWDDLNWSEGRLGVRLPIKPDSFRQDLTQLCSRAGVERITPHQLRAGGAMDSIRRGTPIEAVQRRGR